MTITTSSPDPTFTITITADTICAWCYINHIRLTKTIRLYTKTYASCDTFNVVYKPYLLQPQLTKQSTPAAEKFLERFGHERADTIQRMMDRIAIGDDIKFSRNAQVGDSRASHRVIAAVGRNGSLEQQGAVVGEIMRLYYEGGGDITDETMLANCGVEFGGLSRDVMEAALVDEDLGIWVETEARLAREGGIDAVPHMKINGVVIEGARDVSDLFQTLIEIKEKQSFDVEVKEASNVTQCRDGVCS